MNTVHAIYFSPTFTTKKIVLAISKSISTNIIDYDITLGLKTPLVLTKNELVVIGVPVFSGRVPALASKFLEEIKANEAPAIIVCVYGNRDYDDALLELKDLCEISGFSVISAAAFIARHSIFTQVAKDRPSVDDLKIAEDFGRNSLQKYQDGVRGKLLLKGNKPYREVKPIPLKPKAGRLCNQCGTCALTCPVGAIHKDQPQKTNKSLCISCCRCIVVCPKKARNFRGLLYKFAENKFKKTYSLHREIEIFYSE